MRLITEQAVFNVSVHYSRPGPAPYDVPVGLNFTNLAAQKDRKKEKYLVSSGLVQRLGLNAADPAMGLAPLLLKFRSRFGSHHQGAEIRLTEDDFDKFQPAQISYTQLDTTMARLLFSHFSQFPRESLDLDTLLVSMEADDEVIHARLKFFELHGLLDIEEGHPVKLRPKVGTLKDLENYIRRSREERDFAEGSSDSFSGLKRFSLSVSMPVASGAPCKKIMLDGRQCGRSTYHESSLCVLHNPDVNKNFDDFTEELNAALDDKSRAQEHTGYHFSDRPFSRDNEVYEKPVIFTGCVFRGDVTFSYCRFTDAVFSGCEFHKGAKFFNCTFETARFENLTFNEGVSFQYCRIRGSATFANIRLSELASKDCRICLDEISFSSREDVELRDMRMAEFSFGVTNIRGFRFIDLTWPRTKGKSWWGRLRLPDESDPHVAAPIYRDIQSNYSAIGDYDTASWFYISEKEMARRQSKLLGRLLGLNAWYRWVSNYGQSIILPLIWIPAAVLISTIIMAVLGAHIDAASLHEACLENFIAVFNRSYIPSFLKGNLSGMLVYIALSGVIVTLLSLIVVAARRKFKARSM